MTPASVMTGGIERDLYLRVLDGEWPGDMMGNAYVIGAAPRDQDPLFTGDGIVYRLACEGVEPDAILLRARFVKTWDRELDVAHPGAFVTNSFVRYSEEFGYRGLANTALLPFHGSRLLVTADGGRHWEIDPTTLETLTPLGYQGHWLWSGVHPVTPSIMTSAHPAYDHYTGEVFFPEMQMAVDGASMGTFYNSDLWITRWDGHGGLTRWRVDGVQIRMCCHQIALTRDYIVVADTNFLVEPAQISDPEMAAQVPTTCDVYVIARTDLTAGNLRRGVTARRVQLPFGAVHFTADFDNPGGQITLNVGIPGPSDASEWLRPGDVLYPSGAPVREEVLGFLPSPIDCNPIGRVVIDAARGEVLEQHTVYDLDITWGTGLYTRNEAVLKGLEQPSCLFFVSIGTAPDVMTQRVVNLYASYPDRIVPIEELPTEAVPHHVFRLDVDGMSIADAWTFPPDVSVTSPVFVPRLGSQDELDGYVMCVVLSDSGDQLYLFDAADLASGPVCRLGHPDLDMPWTIHTTWMATPGPRRSTYRVDPARDAELTASLYPLKKAQLLRAWSPR